MTDDSEEEGDIYLDELFRLDDKSVLRHASAVRACRGYASSENSRDRGGEEGDTSRAK